MVLDRLARLSHFREAVMETGAVIDLKLSPRRLRIVILRIALGWAGVQFLGCDQMPPVDRNFDSSLGEDFKPPPQDGGADSGSLASEVGAP